MREYEFSPYSVKWTLQPLGIIHSRAMVKKVHYGEAIKQNIIEDQNT